MSKTVTISPQTTFPDTLKKKLRDKTTRDAVTRSFGNALRKDVKNEALREIRQLNAHVRDIDGDFQRIGAELYKFDKEKFLDEDGKVLRLQHEWNTYHQRFKNILEQSRHNALKATAVMRQYRKTVLSHFKLEEIPDIKKELKGFMEEVDTEQQDALKSQHSFKKLAEDLRLFAIVIEDALERAGARLSVALQNARTRLAQLEKKLATVITKMHSMGVACVAHLAVGAASVAVTIFTLSPAALAAAVGAVVGAVNSGQEYIRRRREATTLRADIQSCNEELTELMEKEELLKKYQRALGRTQKEICALADKIDVVANIWQSLKADMQMLHEELKLVTKGKAITSRFSAKLQAARELYLDLAELLEAYGKSLSPPEPDHARKPNGQGGKEKSDGARKQVKNDNKRVMKGDEQEKDDTRAKKHEKRDKTDDAQVKEVRNHNGKGGAGTFDKNDEKKNNQKNNGRNDRKNDRLKVVKKDDSDKMAKGDRRKEVDNSRKDQVRQKDDTNFNGKDNPQRRTKKG